MNGPHKFKLVLLGPDVVQHIKLSPTILASYINAVSSPSYPAFDPALCGSNPAPGNTVQDVPSPWAPPPISETWIEC